MPVCPKCCNELVKRKSDNTYNCKRHGWVRDIATPPPSQSLEELSKYSLGPSIEVEYQERKLTPKGIINV